MNPFGLGVRAYAAYNAARFLDVRIEGREHLPAHGAAIVAARHYHHLYDGAVLVDRLPRQAHVFVALDWAQSRGQRLFMETLCNLAEWPIALRSENLDAGVSAFARGEARRYLRVAAARTTSLLQRGEVVAIFPEGYPTIDPAGSRKASDDVFLPFRNGVLRLAVSAARATGKDVPIVPAGFRYRAIGGGRYAVTLRLGAPLFARSARDAAFVEELETRRSKTFGTVSTIPERFEAQTLGEYLAVMTQAIFQAGLSWKLIASKWDAYVRLFEGFDPTIVAAFGEGDIDRLMTDGGVVRTRKKITGTVENARTMVALERKFGSMRAYLRSFETYESLAADLKERFAFLGDLSAYYFVFRVGERVPRFEDWERTIKGDHPRMREMIAQARERGWDG